MLLGCAADLRPPALPAAPDAAASAAGAERLASLARAHGFDRWQTFSRARFRLVDPSAPACLRGGLLAGSQELDIELTLRDTTVRARFVGGPRAGQTIGVKGDVAYTVTDQGSLEYAGDACVETYLLDLQRVFTLPLSLAADAEMGEVRAFAAGERELAGRSYELLFVTAPAPYGTSGGDEQYLLWIERSSGRAEWIERTDRRRSRSAQDALHGLDVRDVQGIMLPARIERSGSVGDSGTALELRDLSLD